MDLPRRGDLCASRPVVVGSGLVVLARGRYGGVLAPVSGRGGDAAVAVGPVDGVGGRQGGAGGRDVVGSSGRFRVGTSGDRGRVGAGRGWTDALYPRDRVLRDVDDGDVVLSACRGGAVGFVACSHSAVGSASGRSSRRLCAGGADAGSGVGAVACGAVGHRSLLHV